MLLTANGLAYRHPDGELLFSGIHLSLDKESPVGLVGPNGAGKTTLLEILAGLRSPTEGVVHRAGSLWLVPQIPPDRPPKSGGEITRLRLEEALRRGPDWLLLDEPTNHLDGEARRWLYGWLSRWRGGLCLASHDRDLLERLPRLWELHRGGLRRYGGNFTFYRTAKEGERLAAQRERQTARRQVIRAEREMRRAVERQHKRQVRGRKQAEKANLPKVLMNQRKQQAELTLASRRRVHEDRVERAKERFRDAPDPNLETVAWHPPSLTVPRGKVVLEVRELRLGDLWPASLSFALVGPRRLALTGPNGSGKTTLLSLLRGAPPAGVSGRWHVGVPTVGYLDQHLSLVHGELSLWENLRRSAPHLPPGLLRSRLGRLGFPQAEGDRLAGTLSGGERLRLALGCLFGLDPPPELLLLDEPSNHLDLDSLEELEGALRAYRGALLVVSHDPRFREALELEGEVRLPP